MFYKMFVLDLKYYHHQSFFSPNAGLRTSLGSARHEEKPAVPDHVGHDMLTGTFKSRVILLLD